MAVVCFYLGPCPGANICCLAAVQMSVQRADVSNMWHEDDRALVWIDALFGLACLHNLMLLSRTACPLSIDVS